MKVSSEPRRLRLGLLSAVIATAALSLSACTGTGGVSAICEAAGGDYVGRACAYRWTPEQLAAREWCETHGGRYLGGDFVCAYGRGGP
jgi:hypothetical protein